MVRARIENTLNLAVASDAPALHASCEVVPLMSSRLATIAASLALLAVSPTALADECAGWFCDDEGKSAPTPKPGDTGTATIPDPTGGTDILSGTITQVIPGESLTLKLPTGETKTLKWGELLQLQISGKIVIGGGGVAAHPPPAPNPPPTVIISPPPPHYGPPPPPPYTPPPAYDHYDDPQPKPAKTFKERWALGVGLRFVSPSEQTAFIKDGPSMKDYLGGGTALETSLGYRIGPSWTMYGFFEYGRFRAGRMNADGDQSISSTAVGLGMRANTNPDGPLGFFFDIGAGYRWLTLPYLGGHTAMDQNGTTMMRAGKVQFGGVEMLRLSLGLSVVASKHVRWDVAFTSSLGSFSKYKDSSGGCFAGGDCGTIPEDRRGAFAFGGLSIGGQFDL